MLVVMKDKKFIVDRIEDKSVALEDEKKDIILIDINLFNKQPKDGDVVVMRNNSFYVDEKSTKDKKNRINSLMKGMWEE